MTSSAFALLALGAGARAEGDIPPEAPRCTGPVRPAISCEVEDILDVGPRGQVLLVLLLGALWGLNWPTVKIALDLARTSPMTASSWSFQPASARAPRRCCASAPVQASRSVSIRA